MIRALNPKILTSEDSSYKTVKELNEVIEEPLKKGEIKNIALTGPFGSGKSSILTRTTEPAKNRNKKTKNTQKTDTPSSAKLSRNTPRNSNKDK